MKTIEISVQAAPSFVQVFSYKSPAIAAQALAEWIRLACVGDEIVVKIGERIKEE